MDLNELMAEVAAGKHSLDEVERARELCATFWDPKIGKGYLAYLDGTVIQKNKETFTRSSELGDIMKRQAMLYDTDSLNGLKSIQKICMTIDKSNKQFEADG